MSVPQKVKKALAKLRKAPPGQERDMYPEIKKIFEALGWKAREIKVDVSLRKGYGVPDLSILPEPFRYPWAVVEAKAEKGTFKDEDQLRRIVEEKQKYLEVGTEWMILIDPETWVPVPAFGAQPQLPARCVLEAKDDKALWRFLQENLSPSAFKRQEKVKKFLAGDTSHLGSIDPEAQRDVFFQALERCSEIIFSRTGALFGRVEEFWSELSAHLDYFASVSGRRNILNFTSSVEPAFNAYAAMGGRVDWEEFETRLVELKKLHSRNPPLFRFLYDFVWLQGKNLDEKIKDRLIFGASMLFLAKTLTIRFVEDHSFLGKKIFSNGGIEAFTRFSTYMEKHTTDLVKYGAQLVEELVPSVIDENVYDWPLYIPDPAFSQAVEIVLYWLSFFDFTKTEGDLLSQIYSKMATPAGRKGLGQVFTPPWLADYLVERVMELVGEQEMSALDPACGSGTFLVSLLEKTAGEPLKRRLISYETFRKRIELLHGNDIDPFASALARLQLFWHLLPFKNQVQKEGFPVFKISTGDAISVSRNFFAEGGTWRIYDNRTYDAVVGNPPYVRPEILKATKEQEDESFYGSLSKANLRTKFVYKALKKWLKDNGVLAFVISLSLCDSEESKPLRDLLKKEWAIREIIDLELYRKEIFPTQKANPMLIIIQKVPPAEQDQVVVRFLETTPDCKGDEIFSYLETCTLNYSDIFTDEKRILTKITPNRLKIIRHLQEFPTFEDIAQKWWRKKDRNRKFVEATLEDPGDPDWECGAMIGRGMVFRRQKHPGNWKIYKGENILPCQFIDQPVETNIDVTRVSDPSFWRFPSVLPESAFAFQQICLLPNACRFNPQKHAFLDTTTLFFPERELANFPFDFLVLASIYRFYYLYCLREGIISDAFSHIYPRTLKKFPWSPKLKAYEEKLQMLREQYLQTCKVTNLDVAELVQEKVPLKTLEEIGLARKDLKMRFSELGDEMEPGWPTIRTSLFEWVQINDAKIAELLKEAMNVYGLQDLRMNEVLKLEIPDPYDTRALVSWKEIVQGNMFNKASQKKEEVLQSLDEIAYDAFDLDQELRKILEQEKQKGLMKLFKPYEPYSARKLRGLLKGLDSAERYEV